MNKWLKEKILKWLFGIKWNHRSIPTPDHGKIWASDGEQVWEIWCSKDKKIGDYATSVKFWAEITIPKPNAPTIKDLL